MSENTCCPYIFLDLLKPLEGTREAKKLALMATQVKIERELLAEIMFNGNLKHSDLAFCLEEKRRDLTVRLRGGETLIEWVEAKMCYTDCLARWKTERPRPEEYTKLLLADVEKQEHGQVDRGTLLTTLLFAIHYVTPPHGWKYHKDRTHCEGIRAERIEEYARAFVFERIASGIRRNVIEDFAISLDGNCRLHVFVLRQQNAGRS